MASIKDCCIQRIEADIRALKNRTKQPQELTAERMLDKLKTIDLAWYDEMGTKFYNALDEYRRKEKNKQEKVWN